MGEEEPTKQTGNTPVRRSGQKEERKLKRILHTWTQEYSQGSAASIFRTETRGNAILQHTDQTTRWHNPHHNTRTNLHRRDFKPHTETKGCNLRM
jgi:hypothetical protein